MTEKSLSGKFFSALKTIIAALLAITIASFLQLENTVSAGTVAILTIQPTKKETIKTAANRVLAFICSMVIAFISFQLIGFNMPAFGVFLIFFIFVSNMLGYQHSVAMCAVIMSHFLRFGEMNFETIGNETLIFFIGVTIGVLANMHLRKNTNYITILKSKTDIQIKKILMLMSKRVLDNTIKGYDEECFDTLRRSIRQAKNVADANYNNQLRTKDRYDLDYIHMRDEQCQLLYEMFKNLRTIHTTPFTAHVISDFLVEMSDVDDNHDATEDLMEKFKEIDMGMKSKPLPVTRPEFEDRAKLFMLLRDIEDFITLKLEFIDKYSQGN